MLSSSEAESGVAITVGLRDPSPDMERDAMKREHVRIAVRDAAASVLVAILGAASVLVGALGASGLVTLGLVVVGAFVAFTGLRALAITVRRYRWKAAHRPGP